MSSPSGTLYIGITSNLRRRAAEHRSHLIPGFTSRYNVTRLVWFETFGDPLTAIEREKQLKRWRRAKKVALVESMNPGWADLAATD
jgi:putative endonuclease